MSAVRAEPAPATAVRGPVRSPQRPADTRNRALDALRGLAAVTVVLHHFCWSYTVRIGPHTDPMPSLSHGHFAVDFFFILSGFVISGSLERARSAGAFILDRAVRLWPAFLVSSALTLAVLAMDGRPPALLPTLAGLTMMSRGLQIPPIDPAHWSLSYEVAFYLLAVLTLRRAPERTCALWLGAAFLGTLLLPGPVLQSAILLQLPYGLLFVVGTMLSRLVAGRLGPLGLGTLATALGLTGFGPAVDLGGLGTAGYVALILGFSGVVWAAGAGRLPWLGCRPLVFLGAISYPLYLVHYSVGHVLIRCLEAAGWPATVATGAALGAVVLTATCVHRAVERPLQAAIRLRRDAWSRSGARTGLA